MASFPRLHIKNCLRNVHQFLFKVKPKHWITCLRKDVPTRKYLTWVFSKFVHACIIFLDAFDFHYSYHSSFPQSDTSFMWSFWICLSSWPVEKCMHDWIWKYQHKISTKVEKGIFQKDGSSVFLFVFFLCEINSPNKCYPLCRLFTLWYPFSFWAMKGCSCSNYKSLSSQQYLAFSWTSTSLSVFSM